MAWSIKKVLEKLGQVAGITPKKLPYIMGGHRGIAAGSLKKPDLGSYQELLKVGHTTVSPQEAAAYVYQEQPFFVNSSNVVMSVYYAEEKKMLVEYKGGASYLYSNVDEREAISFVQAQSKGGWIWSNLRIRGTKYGHKKPYIHL